MPSYDPNGNEIGSGNGLNGLTISNTPPTGGYVLSSTGPLTAAWYLFFPEIMTYQIFNTPATSQTYTPTSSDIKYIRVRMVAGGGSGGVGSASNGGGGGASGGYMEKLYSIQFVTYTYNVGTGGAAVFSSGSGNNGSNTDWNQSGGLNDSCLGGKGGEGSANTQGGFNAPEPTLHAIGLDGTTNALYQCRGSSGGWGIGTISIKGGGKGGDSPFGAGGQGGCSATALFRTTGEAGRGYGSGGGSSSDNSVGSGAGANGLIIVEEYYY
jgi:hypothetical protein